MPSPPLVKRALISVSEKRGLTEFARGLVATGIEIYSTGGTRRHLEEAGLDVRDVSEYTGFPEMMDGRLKTLHPKIFGGILCRHDRQDDMQAIAQHDISSFELVVVNLYPFEATIAREGVTRDEAVEQIDIGGPSLVRAAAKNHRFVTIATDPEQYAGILDEIQLGGQTSLELRCRLATEAFACTASYDRAIADYFIAEGNGSGFAPTVNLTLTKTADLRYGENPHQKAAVYQHVGAQGPSIVTAQQLNGKELSYNNLLDLDSALAIVRLCEEPAASVIKHNNPCGAATGNTLAEAADKAMNGDPLSAFGSVLAFNREVDELTADVLAAPGLFVEAIVASGFSQTALELLTTKPKWKKNVRLMSVGPLNDEPVLRQFRYIDGGMLVQDADTQIDPHCEWTVATEAVPDDRLQADLEFGWLVCRYVKSNAIILCKERSLIGVGAGQMSRVDSVDISIHKAGERANGSILASDAFFPFADSIHKAADAGIAAIIQPGGSKKDDEVIAACNQHGIPMILTGRRHFKH